MRNKAIAPKIDDESFALRDTKAMLLIHNRQREIRRRLSALEQRVRTYHDHSPLCDPFPRRFRFEHLGLAPRLTKEEPRARRDKQHGNLMRS